MNIFDYRKEVAEAIAKNLRVSNAFYTYLAEEIEKALQDSCLEIEITGLIKDLEIDVPLTWSVAALTKKLEERGLRVEERYSTTGITSIYASKNLGVEE